MCETNLLLTVFTYLARTAQMGHGIKEEKEEEEEE